MEVPRGFTRCDECEGKGQAAYRLGADFDVVRCPSCGGSGLVPTEKLRHEAWMAVIDAYKTGGSFAAQADAVLAKVAEHLGGRE